MAAKIFNRLPLGLICGLATSMLLTGCFGGGKNTSAPPVSAPSVNDDYTYDIIRKGDKLMIRLTGVPDADMAVYEMPVTDDGLISMPLLGSFKAAGKTIGQLTTEIETSYREKQIFKTPNITITQEDRYINVLGEVRNPQRVMFTPDLTMIKAITACGGFTDYAQKREVRLLRGGKVYTFNAVDALQNPSKDYPLHAGDQIQVPRTIF